MFAVKAMSTKPAAASEGALMKTLKPFTRPVTVSMPAVYEAPHEIMFCPKDPNGPDLENSKPEDFVLAKVPKIEDTLEWLLSSPCPVHQFDEPPVSQYLLTQIHVPAYLIVCCCRSLLRLST
jgi:hypothetical protein